MKSTILAIIFGALALDLSACKTGGSSAKVRDEGGGEAPECVVDAKTWAGRMGLRLKDGGGAAVIDCVRVGEGLNQIGLRAGDRITGLNGAAAVDSAATFEQTCTRLATDVAHRIRSWEFQIERDGGKATVKPQDG